MSSLPSGTRIGAYTIQSALGEGGMGAVYRAHDAELNRDVAIKVLQPDVGGDPDRLSRFTREAQVLASLNHPNIAAIYGIADANGSKALVLELVEGPTLAERIAAGAIPVDEALTIARQIADALDTAHAQGIVHRDLKPANVKLRPDGTVKVLDFGLAKALDANASSATADAMTSPTITTHTVAGLILGTAAYMSPEQASGKPVDKRADIWAFGVVLYEMVTGRRMFEGETISHVLAAVLTQTPDLSRTPGRLRPLLSRCLERDPKKRLRDIGDALTLVTEPDVAAAATTAGRRRWPLVAGWTIAGVLAVALISAVAKWPPSAPAGNVGFPVLSYLPPPVGTTYRDFGFAAGPVVVSPDGRQLAFSAIDTEGVTRLYLLALGQDRAEPIAGTEDAASPFWAPNGRALGFLAGGKLKIVSLTDGGVRAIANAADAGTSCGAYGAWGADDAIVFAPYGCRTPLSKVAATGGEPTAATTLGTGEFGHAAPAFLPDGRHFLYHSTSVGGPSSIWLASLDSSDRQLVMKDATLPQFAAGYLFFVRQGQGVFAQHMDSTGRLSGDSTSMADAERFSVSAAGVLAYQGGTRNGRMTWYDTNGNAQGTIGPVGVYSSVRISPDGTRVLANLYDPQQPSIADLWSYPASGGVPTRLTFGPGTKEFAVWSPDAKSIAYACDSGGRAAICRKPSDGSGVQEQLASFDEGLTDLVVVDWSPDGKYLSFNAKVAKSLRTELLVLPVAGDRKPIQVAPATANQYHGTFSPDSRWISYFSYEAGRPEVFVVPFPGPGGKFQISQTGGWNVVWSRAGRLYYSTLGNRLVEADLTLTGASVKVNGIRPLFETVFPSFPSPFYDVSADGKRFIVITSAASSPIKSIAVLLNWPAKLAPK